MDIPDDSLSLLLGDATSDPLVSDALNFDLELQSLLNDPKMDLTLFDADPDAPPTDTSDSDSGISSYGDRHTILGIRDPSPIVPDTNVFASDSTASDFGARRHPVYQLKREWSLDPQPVSSCAAKTQPTLLHRRPDVSSRPNILCGPTSVIRAFTLGNTAVKPDPSPLPNARQLPIAGCTPTKIPRILARGQNPTSLSYPVHHFYTASASNTSASVAGITSVSASSDLRSLVPSVVSLPVIDDFTASYFQPLPPPTESESYDKLVKKHERMIKNRQAACLSRLRKKEYLERLEHRLDLLKQENVHLRQENNEWRHRYDHLEKCLGDLQAEYISRRHSSEVGSNKSSDCSPCRSPGFSQSSSLYSSSSSPPLIASTAYVKPSANGSSTPFDVKPPFSPSSSSSPSSEVPQHHQSHHHISSAQRSLFSARGGNGGNGFAVARLPRGVRKKVTTSLFAVTCLLALNIFSPLFTPLQGPEGVAAIVGSGIGGPSYDGAKNVGIGQADFRGVLLANPPVAARNLLSVSPNEESPPPSTSSLVDDEQTPTSGLGHRGRFLLSAVELNRSVVRRGCGIPCLPPPTSFDNNHEEEAAAVAAVKQTWPLLDRGLPDTVVEGLQLTFRGIRHRLMSMHNRHASNTSSTVATTIIDDHRLNENSSGAPHQPPPRFNLRRRRRLRV